MLTVILLMVLVIVSMIAVNALFVAGEFAVVSARKARLAQAAESGSRLAKMLLAVIDDHHKLDNYIAASQVGITLSSIVLGIYGQQQIAPLLGPLLKRLPFIDDQIAAGALSALLVLITLTALQVVLGELVPKSLALQYPERVALATVLPMRWSAEIFLRPLILLLNGSGALLLRLLGVVHESGHKHVHSPEEIQLLIRQSHAGGLLDAEERQLLDNAFRLGEMTVGDIVVPRTKMTTAPVTTSTSELLRLAADSDYTRIPVYENGIDNILGFVHLKDLFRLYHRGENADVRKIMRKASFVPETMPVKDAWDVLNQEQTYLAVVFDEYGGTVGMITREDLIEEIFGEVRDEFDEEEAPFITQVAERAYIIRGDTALVYLNSQLSLNLPTDTAHTISGLVIEKLGHMPQVGDETYLDQQLWVRVESVQHKTIDQLLLRLADSTQDSTKEAQ